MSGVVVDQVSKAFARNDAELQALASVSLRVVDGEFVSLIGPSGCGKTTLLRIIAGLLPATTGFVTIDGLLPRDAQRRKAIGFVSQDPALLPWRSAIANVLLPLQVNRRAGEVGHGHAESLLDTVGLSTFARYYPHELSGGMKQRVALARALVFDPSLLLMDEPLGALDELTRAAMRYELLRIWDASRKTVIMVTHSVAEAVAMSDRVIVMSKAPGQIAGEVKVTLPRPREAGIERASAFLDCVVEVQRLLAASGAFTLAGR
ncbi:MAG: ABC transporter ATP-binding protein [Chloroflexi bacterium]|nr:ABC transporter ATP-binding protein [Chloroflexota bacterium]